jgi:hypothetical protein
MFETVKNADILKVLIELIASLGVKEEMPFYDLVAFLRKREPDGRTTNAFRARCHAAEPEGRQPNTPTEFGGGAGRNGILQQLRLADSCRRCDLFVAAAEAGARLELAIQEALCRLVRRQTRIDHDRLDAVGLKILGRPPTHAAAQDDLAVVKGRDNAGMAVGLIVVVLAFLALAFGMGGVRIVADATFGRLAVGHIKHDEAPAAAEVL